MNGNDKILARDLISMNKVSLLLTGSEFTLRWDRGFGKYEVAVNSLLSSVQDWIDSDKTAIEIADMKAGSDKEYRSKIKSLTSKAKVSDVIEEASVVPVRVTVLPKDRKLVTEGGYKGLYSAGGKWYTNKIVSNELVILEWSNLDSAKEYLDNINK